MNSLSLRCARLLFKLSAFVCLSVSDFLAIIILHQSLPNFATMFVYVSSRNYLIFGYLCQRSGEILVKVQESSFFHNSRQKCLQTWGKMFVFQFCMCHVLLDHEHIWIFDFNVISVFIVKYSIIFPSFIVCNTFFQQFIE